MIPATTGFSRQAPFSKDHPLRLIGELGKGAYGAVYRALCRADSGSEIEVALKCNFVENTTIGISSLRELDILHKCQSHPHIIRFLAVYFDPPFDHQIVPDPKTRVDPLFPTMEFAGSGNLENFIAKRYANREMPNGSIMAIYQRFQLAELLEMSFQILTAIEYTHGLGVIHRDLKPNNFVVAEVSPRILLKLVDFGLSRSVTNQGCMSPKITTYPYRAIEICCESDQYGPEVDNWSIGCIFFEMVTGRRFVNTSSDDNALVLHDIYRTHPDPMPIERLREIASPTSSATSHFSSQPRPGWSELLRGCDPGYAEIIIGLLQMDPKKRWSIRQALECPYWSRWQPRLQELRELHPIRRKDFVYSVVRENYPYCSVLLNSLIEIVNSSLHNSWFNMFVVFVCINLIYRVTAGLKTIPANYMPHAKFHVYILLYMVVKYDGCMRVPPTWHEFATAAYNSEDYRTGLVKYERIFLQAANLEVYSVTPYDVAPRKLTRDECTKLMTFMITQPGVIHGKTPREILGMVIPQ